MTRAEFEELCMRAVEIVKARSPIDTGNLRYNAIKHEWIDEETFRIYVDGEPKDKGVAPYMPYTNEPWLSPKWNGKKNPNEGWFDDAAQQVADFIAKELDGEIEK